MATVPTIPFSSVPSWIRYVSTVLDGSARTLQDSVAIQCGADRPSILSQPHGRHRRPPGRRCLGLPLPTVPSWKGSAPLAGEGDEGRAGSHHQRATVDQAPRIEPGDR